MSDTPRTDALLAKWHGEWGADALLTLTREFERELHAMTLRCQAADRTANAALAARPEERAQEGSPLPESLMTEVRRVSDKVMNASLLEADLVNLCHIARAAPPLICYLPCDRHMGMTWTMKVGTAAPMKQVCPICQPPMNSGRDS